MLKATIRTKEECLELRYKEHPEWRNDPDIQEDLFGGYNMILNYIPDGFFGREWDVTRIVTDEDDCGDVGDYLIESWFIPPAFIAKTTTESSSTEDIKISQTKDAFLITRNGTSFSLTPSEFWKIVRYGDNLNTRMEVEKYLTELDEDAVINNVPLKDILDNYSVDIITRRTLSVRISNENGSQIHQALVELSIELARKWSSEYQAKNNTGATNNE